MTGRAIAIVALVLATAAIGVASGGHGGSDAPRAASPSSDRAVPPPIDAPQPPEPRRRPIAAPQHSARSPADAVRTFALRFTNWGWRDAGRQQRELAGLASGTLRRTIRAAARTSALDAQLRRDQPSSRGTVEAITIHGHGAIRHTIVVTREQTFSHAIADEGGLHWHVYTATVARRAGHGWAITSWQAQP